MQSKNSPPETTVFSERKDLMKKSLQRKIACSINLSPELNRMILQSKRSWDEVAGMLKTPEKKSKNRVNNTKK